MEYATKKEKDILTQLIDREIERTNLLIKGIGNELKLTKLIFVISVIITVFAIVFIYYFYYGS